MKRIIIPIKEKISPNINNRGLKFFFGCGKSLFN
jgi:hypothetical protein